MRLALAVAAAARATGESHSIVQFQFKFQFQLQSLDPDRRAGDSCQVVLPVVVIAVALVTHKKLILLVYC